MHLSRGARRIFQLISRFVNHGGAWGCFASQRWFAQHFKCSVRTIQRWLSELFSGGYIAQKRRSQQTSMYNTLKPLQPKMSHQVSCQVACRYKEEPDITPTERKPQGVAWPIAYLETPGGRQYLNPAYVRVRDAVLAAGERIRRARYPEAYLAAIVVREATA